MSALPISEAAMAIDPQLPMLVDRIQADDPSGMEQLYAMFERGVRYFLWRQLGPQDLDDKVHDIFIIVAQSIRRGDLRDPQRLSGYVRTVVRRQVAAHIESAVRSRRREGDIEPAIRTPDGRISPEEHTILQQQREVARRLLQALSKRDREVLVRFYLDEETPQRICREMELTETQFRLIKSRAKARFAEMGKRCLGRGNGGK